MKKKRSTDYQVNLDEITKDLKDGNKRFVYSYAKMSDCFFPLAPSYTDSIMSSYGMPSENSELANQFEEEIQSIIKNIKIKYNYYNQDNDGIYHESFIDKFHYSMTLKSYALNVWDKCSMPLRIINGTVYRIWSSQDIMGSPTIKSIPVEIYLYDVAIRTAEDKATILQLEERYNQIKIRFVIIISIILILIIGFSLLIL